MDLLQTKWRCYVKKTFFRQIALYTIFFLISAVIFVGRPHANRLATCTNSTTDPNEIFTDITMKRMTEIPVNFTDDSEKLVISSLDQEGKIVFPAAKTGNGTNDTEMSFLDTNYIIRYFFKKMSLQFFF